MGLHHSSAFPLVQPCHRLYPTQSLNAPQLTAYRLLSVSCRTQPETAIKSRREEMASDGGYSLKQRQEMSCMYPGERSALRYQGQGGEGVVVRQLLA